MARQVSVNITGGDEPKRDSHEGYEDDAKEGRKNVCREQRTEGGAKPPARGCRGRVAISQ